jgi:hypothetical protein
MKTLTPAQKRAIEWLPADGSWKIKPDAKIAAALSSLCSYHRDLAEHGLGDFGKRGGRCWRYRLTVAGIVARRFGVVK